MKDAIPKRGRTPLQMSIWEGADLFAWLRILSRGGFRVPLNKWPLAARTTAVSIVNTVLKWSQTGQYAERIAKVRPNPEPVFILGHWRSGTTLLHELLILDPRHGWPTTYQCMSPHHFLMTEATANDFFNWMLPGRRPMDNMAAGWKRPQEDEFALANLGAASPYLEFAVPRADRRIDEAAFDLERLKPYERRRWEKELVGFLRRVALTDPRRMILKSPLHSCRLPTLMRLFPGAKFIHIVRDPYVVFSSTVHLRKSLTATHGFASIPDAEVERRVLADYVRFYEAFDRGWGQVPAGRKHEVRYEDLVADPHGRLAEVYAQLDLGDYAEARPRVEEYLASTKNYETNKYRLSPEMRAEVSRSWGGMIRRHGYGEPTAALGVDMPARASILVIDDEPIIRNSLGEYLRSVGHAATVCADGLDALAQARRARFDIALCDINLPGLDGHEVVQGLLKIDPSMLCVLITAYATVESAVEAFQHGAVDYLMKPVIFAELRQKIERFLSVRDLAGLGPGLRRDLHRASAAPLLVGISPAVRELETMCRRLGPVPSPVLIVGEPGSGKEAVARAIHRSGERPREASRFTAVSCASAGVREALARPGTTFLDDVEALGTAGQAEVSAALQGGAANGTRVIAATSADLADAVATGRFRDDLAGRLGVVTLRVPPLRVRPEDVPELADHFLAGHAQAAGRHVSGFDREAMAALVAFPWPGNVRQLERAVERAAIFAEHGTVRLADLPPEIAATPLPRGDLDDLSTASQRFERGHIERVLRHSTDKREAARRLGIGLSSLYRKIEALGIE